MEGQISVATKIGVVLIALAAVIGLGFGVFSIAKGVANEGSTNTVEQIGNFQDSYFSQYNDCIVLGRDVFSLLNHSKGQTIAVLVNTKKLRVGSAVSNAENRYIQYYDDKVYINLNAILSTGENGGQDLGSFIQLNKGVKSEKHDDTLSYEDGKFVYDYGFCLDNEAKVLLDESFGSMKKEGAIEFIDESSKFNSYLICDSSNVVIGVCLTQIDK